jgi:hypothetical protein
MESPMISTRGRPGISATAWAAALVAGAARLAPAARNRLNDRAVTNVRRGWLMGRLSFGFRMAEMGAEGKRRLRPRAGLSGGCVKLIILMRKRR